MRQTDSRAALPRLGIDWPLLLICGFLMFIGWLMIFASEYDETTFQGLFDLSKNHGKQLLFILGAFAIFFLIQFIDSKFIQLFTVGLYGFSLVLLVLVLFTKPINGSTSWFNIGGFRFQPSELSKTSTALMLAYILSLPGAKLSKFKTVLQVIGILLAPTALVLLQGDAGSTLVYFSFLILLYRAGLNPWLYALGGWVAFLFLATLMSESPLGVIAFTLALAGFILLRLWRREWYWSALHLALATGLISLLPEEQKILAILILGLEVLALSIYHVLSKNWSVTVFTTSILLGSALFVSSTTYLVNNVLKSHQQERIWVWLKPERCDPLGPLYNLDQSKHAIGSGGLFGKGFLEGERTKLDYVPEQSTDFIFCTVGEEWGFLGSTILIALYLALLLYIIYIAERQRMDFARYYAYGVAGILFFHLFINLGMTIGLMPVIGIPLPFLSYGGSSLWSFTLLIAILLKLDSHSQLSYR